VPYQKGRTLAECLTGSLRAAPHGAGRARRVARGDGATFTGEGEDGAFMPIFIED
jgi:hypothetical protein